MALVQSPWQLLILRTIQGCFTGTVAAATVLTAGIAPASQIAFALGLLQTGIAAGNSIGPLIGGVVSDFLGHRAAFLSTGFVLGLAGLLVLKGVEDDTRPAFEKGKKLGFLPDIKPIFRSPVLITLMITAFAIQAANTIAAPMLPLFLKELAFQGFAETPQYIGSSTGLVLGVGAGCAAIAAVLAGKYSALLGYWKTLICCLFAGAVFTIPQAFVSNMIQLTVFRAIASFFIGGAPTVLNAIIAVSTDKQHQGSVYGFNSSVSSAGGALGPMIGSGVAMLNYRAVFLTAALLLGLTSYRTFYQRQKIKRKSPGAG
jgi:DHA1 family multidrug resistance protein-like MFS transporter